MLFVTIRNVQLILFQLLHRLLAHIKQLRTITMKLKSLKNNSFTLLLTGLLNCSAAVVFDSKDDIEVVDERSNKNRWSQCD